VQPQTSSRRHNDGFLDFVLASQVAWLLNLRGSDVSYNPVFVSYALVGVDGSASLYVDQAKVTPEVQSHLQVRRGGGEHLLRQEGMKAGSGRLSSRCPCIASVTTCKLVEVLLDSL
jgi:hypothetical protein